MVYREIISICSKVIRNTHTCCVKQLPSLIGLLELNIRLLLSFNTVNTYTMSVIHTSSSDGTYDKKVSSLWRQWSSSSLLQCGVYICHIHFVADQISIYIHMWLRRYTIYGQYPVFALFLTQYLATESTFNQISPLLTRTISPFNCCYHTGSTSLRNAKTFCFLIVPITDKQSSLSLRSTLNSEVQIPQEPSLNFSFCNILIK